MARIEDCAVDDWAFDYITLFQAASELPRRRGGRKTHVSTVYRWTNAGCRGIRLRYVQIGATRCTTREWLAEFFERLTQATSDAGAGISNSSGPALRTPAARQKGLAKADRELKKLGV